MQCKLSHVAAAPLILIFFSSITLRVQVPINESIVVVAAYCPPLNPSSTLNLIRFSSFPPSLFLNGEAIAEGHNRHSPQTVSSILLSPHHNNKERNRSLFCSDQKGNNGDGDMGLLSNRVTRESLKPGDHIYSWRTAYIYAHHGIYVGDDKVIHFTRRGQEVGTGTALDLLLISSGPAKSRESCPTCTAPQEEHGVISSCMNCFLAGGVLYRFEYAVTPALFLTKARGGTCTLAVSDDDDIVVHRAKYLLENGFGCYNVFKKNCEDFAIYCKTGLLEIGQSGQAVSIIGGPLAAALSSPLRMVTTNVYGMAAMAVGVYCASRYMADIGMRPNAVKVPVEELTSRLATGLLQVVEPQIPTNIARQSPQLVTQ